jgi:hypothetical protein
VSVHPGRVARHVVITWYAGCVVGESYPIHACVRAEDILHESAEYANRIRPSALHVIILPTFRDPALLKGIYSYNKSTRTLYKGLKTNFL